MKPCAGHARVQPGVACASIRPMTEMHSSSETPADLPAQSGAQSHCFRMPLFHPGTKVRLAGRDEVVSHIVVRKQLLAVNLVGRDGAVRPDQLELEPTLFSTARRPEPLMT